LTVEEVRGFKTNKITIETNIEAIENNIKKFTLEKPNVFSAIKSLLSLSFINTTIDDKNIINGSKLIIILGIIINDNFIGSKIPTS
tara:strand:- start:301 stop:558 length:258 start_codon:yes stop_codon:yes gene_type:complete